MSTSTTTNLAIVKAVPGTNEPFSTATVNGNYDIIDSAYGPTAVKVSSTVISNSTAETSISLLTIPAASAGVGSAYEIWAHGTATNTTSGSITFRLRLGGTSGTLIATITTATTTALTSTSGTGNAAGTTPFFELHGRVYCVTTGSSGTWLGDMVLLNNFPSSVVANSAQPVVLSSPATKDTTASISLALTAQFSAANASNAMTVYSGHGRKIA